MKNSVKLAIEKKTTNFLLTIAYRLSVDNVNKLLLIWH